MRDHLLNQHTRLERSQEAMERALSAKGPCPKLAQAISACDELAAEYGDTFMAKFHKTRARKHASPALIVRNRQASAEIDKVFGAGRTQERPSPSPAHEPATPSEVGE